MKSSRSYFDKVKRFMESRGQYFISENAKENEDEMYDLTSQVELTDALESFGADEVCPSYIMYIILDIPITLLLLVYI